MCPLAPSSTRLQAEDETLNAHVSANSGSRPVLNLQGQPLTIVNELFGYQQQKKMQRIKQPAHPPNMMRVHSCGAVADFTAVKPKKLRPVGPS